MSILAFEFFLVIGDTSTCETYNIKFVVSLISLNFLGILKSGGRKIQLAFKKYIYIYIIYLPTPQHLRALG